MEDLYAETITADLTALGSWIVLVAVDGEDERYRILKALEEVDDWELRWAPWSICVVEASGGVVDTCPPKEPPLDSRIRNCLPVTADLVEVGDEPGGLVDMLFPLHILSGTISISPSDLPAQGWAAREILVRCRGRNCGACQSLLKQGISE